MCSPLIQLSRVLHVCIDQVGVAERTSCFSKSVPLSKSIRTYCRTQLGNGVDRPKSNL